MGRKHKTGQPELSLATPDRKHATLLLLAAIFIIGLVFRVWANSESLWYDELLTLEFHVSREWWSIITGVPYSPNNHVLHTLLVKLLTLLTGALTSDTGSAVPVMLVTPNTMNIRLLSVLAGAGIPVALAWKARSTPWAAALIGTLALVQPWLMAFSIEARGYALMLLLAAIATNLLERFEKRLNGWYVVLMILAIYAQPIAGEILAGHLLAIWLFHRSGIKRWAIAAGIVLLGALILHLPFVLGALQEVKVAVSNHFTAREYLQGLLTHMATGWRWGAAWGAAAGLLVLLVGYAPALKNPWLRDSLISYSGAIIAAMGAALAVPGLRGVRFALWGAPLLVMAAAGVVLGLRKAIKQKELAIVIPVTAAITMAGLWAAGSVQLAAVEPQPVWQALQFADQSLAQRKPAEASIVNVDMGAMESFIYWRFLTHDMEVAYKIQHIQDEEKSGRELRLIVYYPELLAVDKPELSAYIHDHYVLLKELPGRISSVEIYAKK